MMPIHYLPTIREDESERVSLIEKELRRLRIAGNLVGHYYLSYAVLRVVQDPRRLMLITKDLYREIGRCHGASVGAVDRSIRTAIKICWERGGRDVLEEMAGMKLEKRPSPTEFMDIVADHIRRSC